MSDSEEAWEQVDNLSQQLADSERENALIKEKYNSEPMLELVKQRDAAQTENARLREYVREILRSRCRETVRLREVLQWIRNRAGTQRVKPHETELAGLVMEICEFIDCHLEDVS